MPHESREQEDRFRKRKDKEDAYRKTLPTDDDPPLPPPVEPIRKDAKDKPGRNDPCPCGSGRKYKQCCGKK